MDLAVYVERTAEPEAPFGYVAHYCAVLQDRFGDFGTFARLVRQHLDELA